MPVAGRSKLCFIADAHWGALGGPPDQARADSVEPFVDLEAKS